MKAKNMEFLMTYGWAILVVLIAILMLAYFGVLSPNLRINKCYCVIEKDRAEINNTLYLECYENNKFINYINKTIDNDYKTTLYRCDEHLKLVKV